MAMRGFKERWIRGKRSRVVEQRDREGERGELGGGLAWRRWGAAAEKEAEARVLESEREDQMLDGTACDEA